MDESTTQSIRLALEAALLCAGALVAFWVVVRERRNPPNRAALTSAIAERSWSLPHVAGLLATLLSLYIAAGFVGQFFYEEDLPLVRLIVTYMIYGTMMMLVALINRTCGGSFSRSLGMGSRDLKGLALAPVFYLAAIPFIVLFAKGWHELLNLFSGSEVELQDVAKMVSLNEPTPLRIAYTATAVLIAPIYEEVIFRGVLFPWFAKRAGLTGGVVATSILFAVMHQHLPSLVPLSLMSATACLAYWRTGSLWTSVGVHVIFNTVSVLVLNAAG